MTGLVDAPLDLSLADLRALPKQTQITKHHCIQGWSAVGEWAGVALADVLDRCRPLARARYVVFRGFDEHEVAGTTRPSTSSWRAIPRRFSRTR